MNPPTPTRHLAPGLRALLAHPAFRQGLRDMAGPQVGIAAWGLVTGVAMVKGGLSVPMALFMSLSVYAGSAQLATVPLLASHAPLWVVWFTACCVNLRFVIFSVMWRNYFHPLPRRQRLLLGYFSGDLLFVNFIKRYPDPTPHPDQLPYFWGGALLGWASWQAASIVGIVLANAIPVHWGLGFAGVLALVGVLLSLLGTRTTWVATGVSASAAVAAFALPLRLNILVAIAAAVAVGLLIEPLERRRAVD